MLFVLNVKPLRVPVFGYITNTLYVLVDAGVVYQYTDMDSVDTYIAAVRLDTHREHHIFHYRYLLDWIKQPPVVKPYPPDLQDVVAILNHVTSTL